MAGPLTSVHAVTKLPAQDLDRARRFYRDRLGLEPVEERDGGLRYVCGTTEFHLFLSSGAASGESTQIGFEVASIDDVVADLRSRGSAFEAFDIAGFEVQDGIVSVPGNYPSKGAASAGRSSAIAKATCCPSDRRPADLPRASVSPRVYRSLRSARHTAVKMCAAGGSTIERRASRRSFPGGHLGTGQSPR